MKLRKPTDFDLSTSLGRRDRAQYLQKLNAHRKYGCNCPKPSPIRKSVDIYDTSKDHLLSEAQLRKLIASARNRKVAPTRARLRMEQLQALLAKSRPQRAK